MKTTDQLEKPDTDGRKLNEASYQNRRMHESVVTVYYTQGMPATCFGHSYGHLQGGALQRIGIYRNITEVFEPMAATCTMYAVCITYFHTLCAVVSTDIVPNCSVHGYGTFKVLR